MSQQRSEQRYSYNFRVRAEDPTSPNHVSDRDEMQLFVNATLGLLTGGCELCQYAHFNNSPALFCEKKHSPINWGNARCEQFVRAPTQAPELTR
jgi:hypothetical protein